ncbi:MAG: hypothetical protein KDA41_14340, partial [Planctomycetales bacterium]|nr:hypothetical protein [Planctomycetales bacterium]
MRQTRKTIRRRRRGMTVIVVLGVLALTLALSYAMLRTQTTTATLQANVDHDEAARQAALTGLQIGIRKMHEANWGGLSAGFSGQYSDTTKYIV